MNTLRSIRPDWSSAETLRDFPRLQQRTSFYRGLRHGESPLLLISDADRVARVHQTPDAVTWSKRYTSLQLFFTTWKELLEANPLKMKAPLLSLHFAAVQALEHAFPKPRLLAVYLSLYLQALRTVLGTEAPIRLRTESSQDKADLTNLQYRFTIQAAALLRPLRLRHTTPLMTWWVKAGYSRLEAKILASMTADLDQLRRAYPDAADLDLLSPIAYCPRDPSLESSAQFVVNKMLNRWCHFSRETSDRITSEYTPTAFLPVTLGDKNLCGAFEVLTETGLLGKVRFSQAARFFKKRSPIHLAWAEICAGGITHKLRRMSCYTGYRWTGIKAGLTDRDALISHSNAVQELEDIYGTDRVKPWYQYLYLTRKLLLREDSKLDTGAKLLAFCLCLSETLDRGLGRCFPSRLVPLTLASRSRPILSECNRVVKWFAGESKVLASQILFGQLHSGWNVEAKMLLIKGHIEGAYPLLKLPILLELAKRKPPEEVLLPLTRTLSGTR